MQSRIAGYSVRFQAWFRRDGRAWIAWCPAVDVMTQAETMKRARESLREAVKLWFESCIERNALGEALTELGFSELPLGEAPPAGAETVAVIRQPDAQPAPCASMSFSIGSGKGSDCIEGTIPAYIAALQLGETARARG